MAFTCLSLPFSVSRVSAHTYDIRLWRYQVHVGRKLVSVNAGQPNVYEADLGRSSCSSYQCAFSVCSCFHMEVVGLQQKAEHFKELLVALHH
jgi:hypothetical protein